MLAKNCVLSARLACCGAVCQRYCISVVCFELGLRVQIERGAWAPELLRECAKTGRSSREVCGKLRQEYAAAAAAFLSASARRARRPVGGGSVAPPGSGRGVRRRKARRRQRVRRRAAHPVGGGLAVTPGSGAGWGGRLRPRSLRAIPFCRSVVCFVAAGSLTYRRALIRATKHHSGKTGQRTGRS